MASAEIGDFRIFGVAICAPQVFQLVCFSHLGTLGPHMRMIGFIGVLLSSLFVGACGSTPAARSAVDIERQFKFEVGVFRARLSLLRDPRCHGSVRSRSEISAEIKSLESAGSQMVEKLADVHAERRCAEVRDLEKALTLRGARPGDENPQLTIEISKLSVDPSDTTYVDTMLSSALRSSKATCGKAAQNLPGADCADALSYFRAFNFETVGNIIAARNLYRNVLSDYPHSPFKAYAHFGLALLLVDELRKDPSTAGECEEHFEKARDLFGPKHDLYPFVLLGLGQTHAMLGQKGFARAHLAAVALLANRNPQGSAMAALQRTGDANRLTSAIQKEEQSCNAGDLEACYFFAIALSLVEDPEDDKRSVALLSKTCEGGTFAACTALAMAHQKRKGAAVDEAAAFALHQKACDGGFAPGCALAARMLDLGRGTPRNSARAVELNAKACEGGFAKSCHLAGPAFYAGRDVTRDKRRGVNLFDKGCYGRDVLSCIAFAGLLANGSGVKEDVGRAKALFRRHCTRDGVGCTELVKLLEGDDAPDADTRAEEWLKQGCASGDTRSCVSLGVFYDSGRGKDPEGRLAATAYADACYRADTEPEGCSRYAQRLLQGRGTTKNAALAAWYSTRACDLGDARSCYELGRSFPKGTDPDKDAAIAAKQYETDCNGGDAKACFGLGLLLGSAFGVNRDETRANTLFVKACDGGYAQACFMRGIRFIGGRGELSPVITPAELFFKKACDGGDLQGCYMLGRFMDSGASSSWSHEDPAGAALLYTKACDGGVASACVQLAFHYKNGDGVAMDRDRAKLLIKRACELGDDAACVDASSG